MDQPPEIKVGRGPDAKLGIYTFKVDFDYSAKISAYKMGMKVNKLVSKLDNKSVSYQICPV